jgi:hypothetical protein
MKLIPKYSEKVLKTSIFSKLSGRILDFSGSGLPDHRFSFVKKLFFLVSTHLGLIYCEKSNIQQFQQAFCRTKVQLGPKMAIFEPQQEGSNLDQIQKYFVWRLLGPIPRF